MLLRIGIGLLFGVFTVVYFGGVLYAGYRLFQTQSISGVIGIVGLLLATLLFVYIWKLLNRYVLYLAKAGHIAVIVEIIETGEVPENQIRHGVTTVKDNFAEASTLFGVDQLVKGIVRQFNNAVLSVSRWLSFAPQLQKLVWLLGKGVALAATYIDEAILAHVFRHPEQGRWTAARDGLTLYAKNWKSVLGSTLAIVFALYGTAFLLLLALSPLASVFSGLSTTVEYIGWVVVAGIFGPLYLGFLRPWIKTVVITTFLIESADDTPDSETADMLADRSSKFGELMQKADSEATGSETDSTDSSSPSGTAAD
ncbi:MULTISPECIES: hypothetical protein [Haloarcula]|uniref:hypothetical protein n=1 Tax=Haloarcula TaxID=2237 RepID=UPI0023E78A74|nr:hypothetical protein [Halomicroarcula sp. SHR3]